MNTQLIGMWGLGITIGIVAVIILREVFCWYFKINQIAQLLERILDRLPEKTTEQADESAMDRYPTMKDDSTTGR